MWDLLGTIVSRMLEGFSIKYILESKRNQDLARIGVNLFEIICLFEEIISTGRKIIYALENYITDIVVKGVLPRSLYLESHRILMLELIQKQRVNIDCLRAELSFRNLMAAYISSREMRTIEQIAYVKIGPLKKLREYFDDGFMVDRTHDYLTDAARRKLNNIDMSIQNISSTEIMGEKLEEIFSYFDLNGAKERIDKIEYEVVKWREQIKSEMNVEDIMIEAEKRYRLRGRPTWL